VASGLAGHLAFFSENNLRGQHSVIVFMLLFCFVAAFYVTRRQFRRHSVVSSRSPARNISWDDQRLRHRGPVRWGGANRAEIALLQRDRTYSGFLRGISGYAGGAVDAS